MTMNMTAKECGAHDARQGLDCTPRYVRAGREYLDFLSPEQTRAYLMAYDREELDAAGLIDWHKYD